MTAYRSRPQSVRAIFGGIIDPIKTEYRGIHMRSRLEVDFARHLDELEVEWRYEPTMFGPPGQGYLPDFAIRLDDSMAYIEVKPTLREVPLAQERMTVIWETYPDAVLIVVSAEESRHFSAVAGSPWSSWVERWSHA